MSCFFPSIFKKNTYKKVRFFFVSIFVSLMFLAISGCNAIKSVVSFVGEKITGKDVETPEKPLEGASGGSIDVPLEGGAGVISFESLALWSMILIAIASGVRLLVNRYVHRNTKK
jgi:hypothetical protein